MVVTTAGQSTWDERELWALEDAVPRYSLDAGRFVLWDRLALDVPEFCTRSGEELRICWLDPPLPLQKGHLADAPAERPPRLEEWERLEDGSVRGVLYGVAGVRDGGVRATVAALPAATGDSVAEAEQWCVRTRDGDIFQLGRKVQPAEGALEASAAPLDLVSPQAVGQAAAAAVPGAARALVAVAAPAVVLALLAGGAMVATGGHLHLPHVDFNVFIV